MKIVKLNRRFNIHKNYGFQVGLKFGSWDDNAREVEEFCKKRFGKEAWGLRYNYPAAIRKADTGDWSSQFGQKAKSDKRTPYWIYLRNESMLTMLMLGVEHNGQN
jgi:hypothetical protein